MSSSTHILIVGTGAIGAFYASRLASVSGLQVSTICRSNYSAVKEHGITVASPTYGNTTFKPTYVFAHQQEASNTKRNENISWGYILVTTKVLPELGDPSAILDGLIDPQTTIVVLQNGLGIEEPFHKRFPSNPIISAVCRTSVIQNAPGHITHNHWTRTTIGPYSPNADEASSKASQDRTTSFAELLHASEIPDVDTYSHTGMQFARWHKTAINAACNPTSVLADGPTIQAMALDAELFAFQCAVMNEILAVAENVLGEPVPKELPTTEWVFNNAKEDGSGSKPSMWTDWAAGRKVELEAIVGEPLRVAQQHGLQDMLPRTQGLHAMLRMKQRLRDGKEEDERQD